VTFVVDNALSPVLASVLTHAGDDALRVRTFEPTRVRVRALPIVTGPMTD